jgi:surface-anchored protein
MTMNMTTPPSLRTLPALCSAMALLCLPASAALYTSGHGDFGVAYEAGDFHFHFHADGATVDGSVTGDVEYDIPDVTVIASTSSSLVLPIDFPALGANTGQTIWVLPEVQDPDLPFLGLATEELELSEWGNITFTLGNVTSPSGNGEFALWQSGSFGEVLLRMSTADPGNDSLILPPGSHAHYNWGFTEAGTWQIEMTVSGTHVTDGFQSSTETLTFHVVPEPASALLGGLGMLGLLLRRRR